MADGPDPQAQGPYSEQIARFHAMFAKSPSFAAVLIGPEHRFLLVNPAFERLVRGRQVVGRTIAEALPEFVERDLVTTLDSVFASGEAHVGREVAIALPGPDGGHGERHLDLVYQPIRGPSGDVVATFVEGSDVTDRVHATEALRASERRGRQILDGATDYAFIAINLEGRVTCWNRGAERTLGWSEAEMIDQPLDRIFPDDGAADGPMAAEMAAALAGERGVPEGWRVRRDGGRIWASGEITPLRDDDGEPTGFVKVLRDRTAEHEAAEALRRSEDLLRRAQEAGGVGVFAVDVATGMVETSPEFCRIFGIDPCEAMPATELEQLIVPEDRPLASDADRRRSGSIDTEAEYRIRRPTDGEVRAIARRGQVERDEDGNPRRILGLVVDVTDQRAAQEAIAASEARFRAFAEAVHRLFTGAPHVQWGRYICLYQSVEAEWRPADGMYGFMQRVDEWLAAAGAGTLDPDDAPLHPPVAYTEASTKVVVRADAPDTTGALWVGRADLEKVNPDRRDLVRWVPMADWDTVPPRGEPAVAILINVALPTEYPSNVNALIQSIEDAGVPFGIIWSALKLSAALVPAGDPGHIVLGAPMRRRAAGEPLRQHITIWEMDAEALGRIRNYVLGGEDEAESRGRVAEWMVTAKVGWRAVLEDRPEIVNRRDRGALVEAVSGRRIALLGCGALGSAVAETLVRAGAARLRLLDSGIVRPGILVRQRFADADVGRGKARALKARLDGLGLGCEIDICGEDLRTAVLDRLADLGPELVIDATASRSVAHRIETELDAARLTCPLISMSVSAAAEHGSVSVRMPDCPGGPLAVERQAKLVALAKDRGHPLVQAFWPDDAPTELFLPEPGCSNPTFTGSAADIDHHASGLLNIGLRRVGKLAPATASMDLVAPPWFVMPPGGARLLSYEIDGTEMTVERIRRYRTFTSRPARKEMAAEIRRIARVRSSKVETGGLLFGEIDDSHGRIWIDAASGPPPDSELSPERFLCGTAGTVALAKRRLATSGGSSRFIGIWHTHPVSRGQPSDEDMAAMVQLLHLQPHPPRQVAMLIIGFAETRPAPKLYLFHRGDLRFLHVDDLPYELGDA